MFSLKKNRTRVVSGRGRPSKKLPWGKIAAFGPPAILLLWIIVRALPGSKMRFQKQKPKNGTVLCVSRCRYFFLDSELSKTGCLA